MTPSLRHTVVFDVHGKGPAICRKIRDTGLVDAVIIPVRWDEFVTRTGGFDTATISRADIDWPGVRHIFRFALLTPQVVTPQGVTKASSNWAAVERWGLALQKDVLAYMGALPVGGFIIPVGHLSGTNIAPDAAQSRLCLRDEWNVTKWKTWLLRSIDTFIASGDMPFLQVVPQVIRGEPLNSFMLNSVLCPAVSKGNVRPIWRGLNDDPTWPTEAWTLADAAAAGNVEILFGDDWGPYLPPSERKGRRANRDETYLSAALSKFPGLPGRSGLILQASTLLACVKDHPTYNPKVANLLRAFRG